MGTKRKGIALALGGGGARGLAHIGVLRVLERASVPLDILVGTSIGALVGGAYSAGLSADEMEERVEAFLESPGFQSSALKSLGDARGDSRFLPSKRDGRICDSAVEYRSATYAFTG